MAKQFAKAFYASKAWKETRKQVLKRDMFTCADCYGRANEVHHKTELTPENINDVRISLNPDNLISLCGNCHKKRTLGKGDVDCDYCFDENGQVVRR